MINECLMHICPSINYIITASENILKWISLIPKLLPNRVAELSINKSDNMKTAWT